MAKMKTSKFRDLHTGLIIDVDLLENGEPNCADRARYEALVKPVKRAVGSAKVREAK